MSLDPNVIGKMSYGVYVITTWDRGKPTGCIATSAMQVASSPAAFAISINHNNFTNSCIKQCKHFAVNIMPEDQDVDMLKKMGNTSAKRVKKFEGVAYTLRNRMPVMDSSLGYVSCKVTEIIETETHTVFIGEVVGGEILHAEAVPMTYTYYKENIDSQPAPNAPTYAAD